MILWLEFPEDLVVFFELLDPSKAPASFGDTLLMAMKQPLTGPPRQPQRIRVADPLLAQEVLRVLPSATVVVEPTPELPRFCRAMAEGMPSGDGAEQASYLESGRVRASVVEGLFRAAQVLYKMAPWQAVSDDQFLRIDVPAYEVEGACLSVIGALGQSRGFILFPSMEACLRFLGAAQEARGPEARLDLGTSMLSLQFAMGSELPESMRREVLEHGWPVTNVDAYPVVEHRDRDGVSRPLTERDVRLVTACAFSLTSFFVMNRGVFDEDAWGEPVCESYFDQDDLEVRIAAPYEAGELFEANDPRPPRGSGRPRTTSSGAKKKAGKKAGKKKAGKQAGRTTGKGQSKKKRQE